MNSCSSQLARRGARLFLNVECLSCALQLLVHKEQLLHTSHLFGVVAQDMQQVLRPQLDVWGRLSGQAAEGRNLGNMHGPGDLPSLIVARWGREAYNVGDIVDDEVLDELDSVLPWVGRVAKSIQHRPHYTLDKHKETTVRSLVKKFFFFASLPMYMYVEGPAACRLSQPAPERPF